MWSIACALDVENDDCVTVQTATKVHSLGLSAAIVVIDLSWV